MKHLVIVLLLFAVGYWGAFAAGVAVGPPLVAFGYLPMLAYCLGLALAP